MRQCREQGEQLVSVTDSGNTRKVLNGWQKIRKMLSFEFEDGCFFAAGPDSKEQGFEVNLPGGIELKCPHGKKTGVKKVPPQDNQECQNGCCQALRSVWGNEEDDRIFSTADSMPINLTYLARGIQNDESDALPEDARQAGYGTASIPTIFDANMLFFEDGCVAYDYHLPAGFSLRCPHGKEILLTETQENNLEFGIDFSIEE